VFTGLLSYRGVCVFSLWHVDEEVGGGSFVPILHYAVAVVSIATS
jgi:hypothetical protein